MDAPDPESETHPGFRASWVIKTGKDAGFVKLNLLVTLISP